MYPFFCFPLFSYLKMPVIELILLVKLIITDCQAICVQLTEVTSECLDFPVYIIHDEHFQSMN